MVHLSRIYTKFGDAGKTMLGDGAVVPKTSVRVGAYGAVDEANAAIGAAVSECALNDGPQRMIRTILLAAQQDLFDAGADLATPIAPGEPAGARLRITEAYAKRLEAQIDERTAQLAPLTTFVLPGGSRLAAALHVARTIVRRAEREAFALLEAEPQGVNPHAVVYLNRLSDLLFVLARFANRNGQDDTLWKPGANR